MASFSAAYADSAEAFVGWLGVAAVASPRMVKVKCFGRSGDARAAAMTSGPIPAGSPRVMRISGMGGM